MARSPVPLLDAVAGRCRSTADRDNAERDAARARCWLAIQRIADGDLTGGSDAAKFASDLDACGLSLADVRSALDEINACRKAQAEHALAVEHVAKAAGEVTVAVAARDQAKAALDAAEIRRSRSLDVHADAGEVLARATGALNAARAAEASLRDRGYGGSPLVTTAPPAAPKPRRWRVIRDLVTVGNKMLNKGSVVALDASAVLLPNEAVPVGDDEPLVEHLPQPGEPGGRVLATREAVTA